MIDSKKPTEVKDFEYEQTQEKTCYCSNPINIEEIENYSWLDDYGWI